MGDRRFEVVGMLLAVTFAGMATALTSGASWVEEESGKTKVEMA